MNIYVFIEVKMLKCAEEILKTYFLSVGDSFLDQLKIPSTMEILYMAGWKKRWMNIQYVKSLYKVQNIGSTSSLPLLSEL